MSDDNLDLFPQPPSAEQPEDAGQHDAHCSRRGFLDHALPFAAAFTAASCMPRIAFGRRASSTRDVLVVVFLRGGMDGLTTCVPYGDADYYRARPKLGIPPPGSPDGAIDLDSFFGLHPSLAPLMLPYHDGRLAIVHATGSTDPTRSHFDAERHLETGQPEQPSDGIGWLARHLTTVAPVAPQNALRAAALSVEMPYTLRGAPNALPVNNLADFTFIGSPATAERRKRIIRRSYGGTLEPMAGGAIDSLSAFDALADVDFDGYVPANGAVYPSGKFGTGLKNSSALIKADIGTEALMLKIDDWDTHSSQAGMLNRLLKGLGEGLQAFYLDNLTNLDRVVVVVMSEFGRRVAENTSAGTDHGHGNCMMVMGGHVAGGRVLSHWPGLAPAQLDDGDLAITIDYRDILSEILAKRMESNRLDLVFPSYTPNFQGIIV